MQNFFSLLLGQQVYPLSRSADTDRSIGPSYLPQQIIVLALELESTLLFQMISFPSKRMAIIVG